MGTPGIKSVRFRSRKSNQSCCPWVHSQWKKVYRISCQWLDLKCKQLSTESRKVRYKRLREGWLSWWMGLPLSWFFFHWYTAWQARSIFVFRKANRTVPHTGVPHRSTCYWIIHCSFSQWPPLLAKRLEWSLWTKWGCRWTRRSTRDIWISTSH